MTTDATDLFSGGGGGLFDSPIKAASPKLAASSPTKSVVPDDKKPTEAKKSPDLFSGGGGLFDSPKQDSATGGIGDLFGGNMDSKLFNSPKSETSKSEPKKGSPKKENKEDGSGSPVKKVLPTTMSMFDDDGDVDLFGSAPPPTKKKEEKPKQKTKGLFDDASFDGLFGASSPSSQKKRNVS